MVPPEWHEWHAQSRQPGERRPYHQPYSSPAPRPPVQEDSLKQMFVQVERKIFSIALKENVRGRFLRITEEANNKFTSIILPISGLEEFQTVINEMIQANKENPPKSAE